MEDLHPGGRDRGQDPHRLLPAPQLHQDDGGRLRVCGRHKCQARGNPPIGDKGRTIRAKRAKNLRFQVGGQWISKKKVKVNIPARPFLGLSDEDMQEIKATTEEFIGRDD
mgnify:CR=1 FL=1